MKHWKTYLDRQNAAYTSVAPSSAFDADMVVVIPCYNEPGLFDTLHNLRTCARPSAKVMTLVVINSGEHSDETSIVQNRLSYEQAVYFADKYNEPGFHYFPLLFERLPAKHAGVGLARKIGMDLAVSHFLHNGNAQGIIVSLDADCTVSENFLVTIFDAFSDDKRLNTTVHNFFHRVEKNNPQMENMENAVRQYEDYIRYFREMLKQTGFPYYYHTIGSAFAVTADAYVRVGGMGRQQGGEDFYFLQKVFALGNVKELNDAFVYPMARFSDRIPFGTGPALQKIMEEPDGTLKVYSRKSFSELKRLFEIKDSLFKKENKDLLTAMSQLHPSLAEFLLLNGFPEDMVDCNKNSASLATFQKRFFHHFNAFRIIKYLNAVHPDPFPYETSM
jgi:glycosyltransferase involved in cell wall biosynthesis